MTEVRLAAATLAAWSRKQIADVELTADVLKIFYKITEPRRLHYEHKQPHNLVDL